MFVKANIVQFPISESKTRMGGHIPQPGFAVSSVDLDQVMMIIPSVSPMRSTTRFKMIRAGSGLSPQA